MNYATKLSDFNSGFTSYYCSFETLQIATDASDYGIGAILTQEYGCKLFPICYAREKLSDAQLNYSTIANGCLALVWGIKRFNTYMYGVRFVLQTDDKPLKPVLTNDASISLKGRLHARAKMAWIRQKLERFQ